MDPCPSKKVPRPPGLGQMDHGHLVKEEPKAWGFSHRTKKDLPGNSAADLLGDCDPCFLGWLL